MKISPSAPLIYLITDGTLTNDNFEKQSVKTLGLVEKAVAAGVPLIQIREKNLFTRRLLELASRTVAIARGSETAVLVNDRADIALAAGANGVHLTEKSLPADAVRKSIPGIELIGVSTHSFDGVKKAVSMGADFAVFGPVFESPGKDMPTGIENFKEICEAVKPFPILALGGIAAANCEEVLKAGAKGFAAIRFLNDPASFELLAKRGLLPAKK